MLSNLYIALLAALLMFPIQCHARVVEIRSIADDIKLADYVACVSINKSVEYTD